MYMYSIYIYVCIRFWLTRAPRPLPLTLVGTNTAHGRRHTLAFLPLCLNWFRPGPLAVLWTGLATLSITCSWSPSSVIKPGIGLLASFLPLGV